MTYFIILLFILLAINEYNQFKLYRALLDETHQAKISLCYAEIMNAYTHKKTKMVDHWVKEMHTLETQFNTIMKHPFKSYIRQETV